MPVELRNEQRAARLDVRRFKRQAAVLLRQVGREKAVLSILLTDDKGITPLHELWMNEPGPTDVLSFPMEEEGILGDVAISVETAARCRPNDPASEVLDYLIHGLLHLCGHDHRLKAERLRMERQAKLLRGKVREGVK